MSVSFILTHLYNSADRDKKISRDFVLKLRIDNGRDGAYSLFCCLRYEYDKMMSNETLRSISLLSHITMMTPFTITFSPSPTYEGG